MCENEALKIYREKLAFLQKEEAIATDGAHKFALQQQIKEAKAKIAELEDEKNSLASKALYQISSPPADFVGREEDLNALREGMSHGGVAISGLAGMGGVGKTALAFKLAEELAPHYPDASLYLDLRGVEAEPVSVAGALQHFIRAFHPTAQLPDDVTQLRALYLSVLHEKRAVVLLDNAKDAAQVAPLLPPANCAVIVTSRHYFTVPGLVPRRLDTLPTEDAQKLLLEIAPRIGEYAAHLAKRLGHLPLALRLAASALAARPDFSLPDYLRRIENLFARPEMKEVEASLQLSYNLLNETAQKQWCALAVFPATFDKAAAEAVWDVTPDEAQDTLSDLCTYSVLEWNESAKR